MYVGLLRGFLPMSGSRKLRIAGEQHAEALLVKSTSNQKCSGGKNLHTHFHVIGVDQC
jgi:hypothetical protein